jgi:hypothetical protein
LGGVIIIFYTGISLKLNYAEQLLQHLQGKPEGGFFSEKAAYSNNLHTVIYFKATLTLAFFYCLFQSKNYLSRTIIALALYIAASRFGLLLILIVTLYQLTWIRKNKLLLALIIISIILFLYIYRNDLSINEDLVFSGTARILHFYSLYEYFIEHPHFLIFGSGPGSEFYTNGFNRYTDDIEISQLELLRRYGLVFFICFHLLFFKSLTILKGFGLGQISFGLFIFYIAAASNPVLTALSAVSLYAVSLSILSNQKIIVTR